MHRTRTIGCGGTLAERLQILGSCGWWTEGVRCGRWSALGGEDVAVAAVLGPEAEGESLARWRDRALPWIGRRTDGVLGLLGVEPIDRRAAWVYESCEGASLAVVLGSAADPLPLRVGAQLIARCAEILEPLAAAGRIHPGPAPHDVLLLPDGSVLLAGFVGPFAADPIHREHRKAEDSATVVWRLGVLLAEILTGTRPKPAPDRVAHDLMLRRMLIRIMSRPGPMFPERYRDWLCGMLSWDAEERPLLTQIGPGLRDLASTLPSPDLALWAAKRIPELHESAPTGPQATIDPAIDRGTTEIAPVPLTDRTEEASLADTPDIDDLTAVSTDGGALRRQYPSPERGTIPVQVGPPPEAVPKPTRLPDELFRTPRSPVRLERAEVVDSADLRRRRRIVAACVVLFGLALLLSWYLWD